MIISKKENIEVLTHVYYELDGVEHDVLHDEGAMAILLNELTLFVGGGLEICVNTNGIFTGDLPCADAFELDSVDQIEELYTFYEKYGHDGVVIFSAKATNQQPCKRYLESIKEEYGIDLSYLPENQWGQ